MTKFWSVHTHTKFSQKDALPAVELVVQRAAELEYEALAITDHGNMAASKKLYVAARKQGIKPLPGSEIYLTPDRHYGKRPLTMHMGMVSYTERGYRNLVGLSTLSHRNYRYMPLLDFGDLAQAAEAGMLEGIAITTGCWFGLVPKILREGSWDGVHNVLTALTNWFGDNVYVEVQNHMIYDNEHDDDEHSQILLGLADELGLPMVLGQDSHYCHADDKPAHEMMKSLLSWSDDPDDAIFPGDGYHMVDTEWMREHHEERVFERGMEGLADLAAKADVVIPELDTFKLNVPDTTKSGDPDGDLRTICTRKLNMKFADEELPATRKKTYLDRMERELETIEFAGFAGYLLFTKTVTDFMRTQDIFFGVRGSASGSILCWLLDISQLDPIKWGLQFERFISRDRSKPPDIDLDIQADRRGEVVTWLSEQYEIARISTWSKLGLKKDEVEGQGGSLVEMWKRAQRNTGKDQTARIPSSQWSVLEDIAMLQPFNSYGAHPAGMLIIPDAHSATAVPLQMIPSSKTLVSGFDMKDVEAFGMVKLDLLGLKTYHAIKLLMDATGVDIWTMSYRDPKVYQRIAQGQVAGVFQLEGWTQSKGCKRLKPRTIKEIIAAVALFRPAAMKSGAMDSFLDRRNGTEKTPLRHDLIDTHTKDTYGVIVYQEQVIDILKGIGLSFADIELARGAIKASNEGVGNAAVIMDGIIAKMTALSRKKGLTTADIQFLDDALAAYAGYGFNKAHAAAYGIVAYATAWFSIHHPLLFWSCMLQAYTGSDLEVVYIEAARKDKIRFRPAHVNHSASGYSVDKDGVSIRKPLASIPGIGTKIGDEVVANAPYESLADFARRVNGSKVSGINNLRKGQDLDICGGAVTMLYNAGALEGLDPTEETE